MKGITCSKNGDDYVVSLHTQDELSADIHISEYFKDNPEFKKIAKQSIDEQLDIPEDAQNSIDFLSEYTETPDLSEFNVIHIYSTGEYAAKENMGIPDAMFMKIVGFSFKGLRKRTFKELCDDIRLYPNNHPELYQMKIFVDGSTLLFFRQPVSIMPGQTCYIKEA
ncbi:MAG TPA: hypothetical protein PLQ68_10985 [Clostridia bacterium]|nr:hypothetical protein [Clostridia bacterium]